MKKIIMIFCIVCITAVFLITDSSLAMVEQEAECKDRIDEFTTIVCTNIGDDEYCIGYSAGDESELLGPEDFIVEGTTAIILDSVNKAVKIFDNGEFSRSMDISDVGWAMSMAKLENRLFILDTALERIVEYDFLSGDLITVHPIPSGCSAYIMIGLYAQNSSVYFMDCNYVMHDILNPDASNIKAINGTALGSNVTFSVANTETTIAFNRSFVQFIGSDSMGNLYISVFDLGRNASVNADEFKLNKYNSEGRLIGSTNLPIKENCFTPERYLYLSNEGQIYLMGCGSNTVHVERINICDSWSAPKCYNECVPKEDSTRAPMTTDEPLQGKRASVESTASDLASFSWQIVSKYNNNNYNNIPYPRCEMDLPSYVSGKTVGTTLNGMPYAFGIKDNKTTFNTKRTSNAPDGHKMITGNIDSEVSSIDRHNYTTGEDCSGFVSAVYGISNSGTVYFANHYNDIEFYDLRRMDYLVYSNHHIVLFVRFDFSSSKVVIYDATKTTAGRVALRYSSIANYTTMYTAKTPWNPICNPSIVYSFDENTHWHACLECGYRLDEGGHNFVYSPSGPVCSVCGFSH